MSSFLQTAMRLHNALLALPLLLTSAAGAATITFNDLDTNPISVTLGTPRATGGCTAATLSSPEFCVITVTNPSPTFLGFGGGPSPVNIYEDATLSSVSDTFQMSGNFINGNFVAILTFTSGDSLTPLTTCPTCFVVETGAVQNIAVIQWTTAAGTVFDQIAFQSSDTVAAPEPATLGMVGAALVGLRMLSRKRSNR